MERILACLQDMAPFALAALPLYGLGRWLYIRRRKRSFQRLREIGLALLAVYGVGLASQTVMTGFQASMDGGGINLIPGKVIADGIRLGLGAGNWHYLTLKCAGKFADSPPHWLCAAAAMAGNAGTGGADLPGNFLGDRTMPAIPAPLDGCRRPNSECVWGMAGGLYEPIAAPAVPQVRGDIPRGGLKPLSESVCWEANKNEAIGTVYSGKTWRKGEFRATPHKYAGTENPERSG